ncbi:MAG: heparinase II/III family protein [Rhodospirillaceae bacterium]|nr:heparinase II/III family protein [Rhodospirillaceae bacterium]
MAREAPERRTAPGEPVAPQLQGWISLPVRVLVQRMLYRLRQPLLRRGLFETRTDGGGPSALKGLAVEPWPGSFSRGATLLAGEFNFAGQTIRNPEPLWAPEGASEAFLEELHGFAWLNDLVALPGEEGRRLARRLVERWVEDNGAWAPLTWRPDVLGERLASWLSLQSLIFDEPGGPALPEPYLRALRRQTDYLAGVLPAGLTGSALMVAIKGLILGELALSHQLEAREEAPRGRELLERELPAQVLPDGSHIERSPTAHLRVLRHLIDLRSAYASVGEPWPEALDGAIARMAPVLRLYQHGDGGLALFNDSNEEDLDSVNAVLARTGTVGPAAGEAPQIGFQRLEAGRTVVVVDAGVPPPPGYDGRAHAGTLSFEFSVGPERMIVNCGAYARTPEWQIAQRTTAAHSTLVVEDTNSSTVLISAGKPQGLLRRPKAVTCRRDEADGSLWLETSHDGYLVNYAVIHRRRLYLAAGGEDFRGEDQLIAGPHGTRRPLGFAVRFHLHPDVQATMAQDGRTTLLRLPGRSGWRLRATAGTMSLEESVYMGRRGAVRRTQQIVISHTMPQSAPGEGAVVKWALARETRRR